MDSGNPAFLAIDFFCGAGGTTRGLIDAGGYVLAGVDKADGCDRTYEANNVNRHLDRASAVYVKRDIFPKSDGYPEGEQDDLFRDLIALYEDKMNQTKAPLLLSICAPCQPFTRLTQIEMTEERSKGRERDQGLLAQTLPFVDQFEPEMILCENVAGIQKDKYGGVWQAFDAALRDMDYVTGSAIVNAAKFGVPQNRKRSIMLAVKRASLRDGSIEGIAVPDHDPKAGKATVRSAIGHLPPIGAGDRHPTISNHQAAGLTDINRRRLEAVAPGGNNHVFSGTDLELECHRKMREKEKAGSRPDYTAGFSDVYCRMAPDEPAPAITTKFFASSCGRYGHYDPAQVRAISIREGAALQSFPDDYVFHGGSIQRDAKMVGNAVPPKLSEFFARHLLSLVA